MRSFPSLTPRDKEKLSSQTFLLDSDLAPHLVVFIICFCILAGALMLTPAQQGSHHLHLGPIVLPHSCTFMALTGLPCPGCGLTRSIVAAMHGDLEMSLSYHRMGLLTLVYIFLQFVYCLGVIVIPKQRPRLLPYGRRLNRGLLFLGILLGLNWVLSLVLMI